MVRIEEQAFFLLLCNSSPTCRGRRILAIYYVKNMPIKNMPIKNMPIKKYVKEFEVYDEMKNM